MIKSRFVDTLANLFEASLFRTWMSLRMNNEIIPFDLISDVVFHSYEAWKTPLNGSDRTANSFLKVFNTWFERYLF